MLTTNECLNLEDYAFKYSPESCSGNSCSTDYTDLPSDEDFLQQLSSDLDIPLLLNPGEDELSLLNSFFDKSPEEIMSEIALPSPESNKVDDAICKQYNEFQRSNSWKFNSDYADFSSPVKLEPCDTHSSSGSSKSSSPVQSPANCVNYFEIKDELKNEPPSPGSVTTIPIKTDVESNLLVSTVPSSQAKMHQNHVTKMGTKRVPIQPKTPFSKSKVVLFNNVGTGVTNTNMGNPPPPKVVVLENVSTVPITTVAPITPTTTSPVFLNSSPNLSLNVRNIDPKVLKRQQRKIKNRESACLSRKKKKDYLTSLENQVKELVTENQKLKLQNMQLTERLMKYEGNQTPKTSNVKSNIVLCMFLFSVAFNIDYIRSPFVSKNQENIVKSSSPKLMDHHGRNLLWTADDFIEKNSSNFSPFSMCPAAINQTESARLVLELERWIGKPKDIEKPAPVNVTKLSVQNTKLRSLRKRKQKKYSTSVISSMYSVTDKVPSVESNNELQVFTPTLEQLYSEFFEAINRQDDTFYVVSFSDHHMLLPALHHNKTRRPKMSLIMPSVLRNDNISQPTLVPLMQIDCEVLDTRLIQVRYGSIPQHLRKHGNSTTYRNPSEDVSKTSNSGTNYTHQKAYKPYFIKPKTVTAGDDTDFYNVR